VQNSRLQDLVGETWLCGVHATAIPRRATAAFSTLHAPCAAVALIGTTVMRLHLRAAGVQFTGQPAACSCPAPARPCGVVVAGCGGGVVGIPWAASRRFIGVRTLERRAAVVALGCRCALWMKLPSLGAVVHRESGRAWRHAFPALWRAQVRHSFPSSAMRQGQVGVIWLCGVPVAAFPSSTAAASAKCSAARLCVMAAGV
jgi:hypothetical protein